MKNFLIIPLVVFFSVAITSCTEVLDVNLDKENDRLVIEGLVSNEVTPFTVKLSSTLALDDKTAFPAVNNAFVTIADNTGNLDTLTLTGNGVYKTNGPRQGIVGRTYILTVVVDGRTYVGKDVLTSISPIDSLFYLFHKKGDVLGVSEDGFYAYFYSTDPQDEKNYYYEEVFRNDSSVLKSNQIFVYDDKFLGPFVVQRLPGKLNSGDKLNFNHYSLSEDGYNYLNGVALQLQNDGGFFSTPPANAPTNISGGALGFFRASSVARDSLLIP